MDALNTLNNHWSWYTTNIRDRHGNTIDITYKTNSSNFIYIDTVTASDGRQVKFEYLDEESAYIRLNRITANEQTWTYRYESIEAIGPGYGDNYHNLTEVIRPDGLRWRYSYYPYTSLDAAGNYALKTVTYPYGANITYTYQHIDFTPTDLAIDRTTAIATKEVSGNPPGISVGPGSSLPSGIWRFEFEPHSPELFFTDKGTWTSGLDKTTGECRAQAGLPLWVLLYREAVERYPVGDRSPLQTTNSGRLLGRQLCDRGIDIGG